MSLLGRVIDARARFMEMAPRRLAIEKLIDSELLLMAAQCRINYIGYRWSWFLLFLEAPQKSQRTCGRVVRLKRPINFQKG